MSDPHLLESPDDLFTLFKPMPEQDRFNALGIIRRMHNNKVSVPQAMEEVKALLFKNNIYQEEVDE